MGLDDVWVGIDGSASRGADAGLLRRCHALVRLLARRILEAGGGLVLFVGREPRVDEGDAETAMVFTWTLIEAVRDFVASTTAPGQEVPRPLARIVYSPRSLKDRIPGHRLSLWQELVGRGALRPTVIDDDDHLGVKIREGQARLGDAQVIVSGGKGVAHLASLYRADKRVVVPLNPPLGASLDDGEGAAALHRRALVGPDEFAPGQAERMGRLLSSLSFEEGGLEGTAARVASFLADAVPAARRHRAAAKVDVAVLTVIPPELKAARNALGILEDAVEKTPQGTNYWRGTVPSRRAGRDYQVALTCIGNPGNYDSTLAAAEALHDLSPRAIILMGIAAGVRGKVKIGHVVLADRVYGYESGAEVVDERGAHMVPRPEVGRMDHAMEQDVAAYLSQPYEGRLVPLMERVHGGPSPRAPKGRGKEYRDHVATSVRVNFATIASGEKLLRNPDKLRWMREHHGRIEAGEMEAMGIYTACRRTNASWLIIRGISDFGDALKDDRFHGFASNAAASVMADLLANAVLVGDGSDVRKSRA